VGAVEDPAIIAALVAGDPRGLEASYQRYADRLYTYARGTLPDPEAAAEPVHDAFVLASQLASQLPEPERLRPWLYTATRNECLRRRRSRSGHPAGTRLAVTAGTGLAATAGPDPPGADPGTGLPIAELRDLIAVAAESLDPTDREVFELAVRHELPAPEIAVVLGTPPAKVPVRLARARAWLEPALSMLLMARTGTRACRSLAGLLAGWDGRPGGPFQERINQHVPGCPECRAHRRGLPPTTALIAGYAAAPYQAPPDLLWPRLERDCFDPASAPERAAIVRRAGRRDRRTGFPRPLDAPRRRRVAVAGVATIAAALLVAGTGAIIPTRADQRPDPPALPAAPAAAPTPAATAGPPGGATASPTGPAASPTGIPAAGLRQGVAPAVPPAPEPSPPGPTTPAVTPLVVEAGVTVDCIVGWWFGYTLEVTATANRDLDGAELFLADGPDQRSFEMAVDGSGASIETGLLTSDELQWWIEVAAGGEAAGTEPAQLTRPCD
jgi:RNA polymerase sigma factor (sigma-70 family)